MTNAHTDAAVPVIDLACPQPKVVSQLDEVCRTVGFFQIVGHGVDPDVNTPMWATTRRFFDLPLAERMAAARPRAGYPYGYVPLSGEALARSLGDATPPDVKETFNAGPPLRPAHELSGPDERDLFGDTPWPPALPGMATVFADYFTAMDALANRLMGLFAMALNLPADHFAAMIDRAPGALRALNYPAQATAPIPGQLRAGAHTDYGTLTILRQDDAPGGLEVRDPHSAAPQWIPVPALPGAFVVNIGDLLARWTNDRWRSTLHRVVNPPVDTPADARRSTRRQSIAFFHNANFDCEVRCLPTCLAPGEAPRYPPVRAGAHLVAKFRSSDAPATPVLEAGAGARTST